MVSEGEFCITSPVTNDHKLRSLKQLYYLHSQKSDAPTEHVAGTLEKDWGSWGLRRFAVFGTLAGFSIHSKIRNGIDSARVDILGPPILSQKNLYKLCKDYLGGKKILFSPGWRSSVD